MLRVPRLLVGLTAATLLYVPFAIVLDRDPTSRPLENPYRLLQRIERDAVLRSDHFGEVGDIRRTAAERSFSFDLRTEADDVVQAGPGARVEWAAVGLLQPSGSLVVHPSPDSQGVRLRLPPTPGDAPVVTVELRVRTDGTRLALALTPDDGAPREEFGILVEGCPASLRPDRSVACDQPADWVDLSLSMVLGERPHAGCCVDLLTDADTLWIDQVRWRPGPRIDGLVARGHARGFGSTEATRDVKRFLRRGPDERLCLLMPADTTLTYRMEIPKRARLDLAVTALAEDRAWGATSLTVALRRVGEFEETLLRTLVTGIDETHFTAHRVDLARFAGELVELQFRVEGSERGRPPVIGLAHPTISAPRDDPPPHVFVVRLAVPDRAEQTSREGDPREFLRSRGLSMTRYLAASPDADADLLSTWTSQPPLLPRPAQHVALAPGLGLATLPEVLGERGYVTFAAVANDRPGWVLEGFAERWNADDAHPIDGLMRWFDRSFDRPCFSYCEFPDRDPQYALRQLIDALDARDVLDQAIVWLLPADVAPPETAESIVVIPGRKSAVLETPFAATSVAASLVLLATGDTPSAFGGGWTGDQLFSITDAPTAVACGWDSEGCWLVGPTRRAWWPRGDSPADDAGFPASVRLSGGGGAAEEDDAIRRTAMDLKVWAPDCPRWTDPSLPPLIRAVFDGSTTAE